MKKRIIRFFGILAVICLCILALAGCNSSDTTQTEPPSVSEVPTEKPTVEAEEPTDATEEIAETTFETKEPLDDSMFNIFYDGGYLCAFVTADDRSYIDGQILEELRNAIYALTGARVPVVKESELADGVQSVVLIGNTSFEESVELNSALEARGAAATVKNDKLVIAYTTYESGKEIVDMLAKELEKSNADELRLSLTYDARCKSLPELLEFPYYEEATEIDCGADTLMYHATNVTPEQYIAYCTEIETAEFEKTFSREVEGNYFANFIGLNEYIYAYYTKYNSEMRIIIGPREAMAENDYSMEVPDSVTPYIASIPQPANGEGYIFRLSDGRFIIFDGGYKGGDRVYKTLRELESGEIVIAAWFISHPHGDHYPAMIDFVKNHSTDSSIVIERVMHNYAHHEMYNIDGTAGVDNSGAAVLELYETLETYLPFVPVIKVHTGQVINFGSDSIEIIYTMEDLVPMPLPNVNDSSLVIRANIADTSIMLLADTCYVSGPILADIWGDHLKSDIVQIAHHGQWPSEAVIYNKIKGEVILFPAVYARLKIDLFDSRWKFVTDTALSYAKDIYVSGDALEIIELPYTVKNNKQEMIEYIKNYQ